MTPLSPDPRRPGPWVAAVAAVAWCASYSGPLIDPFSLDVVLRDDWAAHSFGWLFFRNERFLAHPLGSIPNFLYPLGSTLGYQDAIPWVALVLRPISALLPLDFQYLGLWLLACSATLALAAAWLARRLTPHWEQQALIGTLAAMSPSLMARIVHPALCSHGLIVAAIGCTLVRSTDAGGARRIVGLAIALVWLAAVTNPYITLMVLSLAIAVPLQQRHMLGFRTSMVATVGMLAGVAAIFALLGYASGGVQDNAGGFGYFSANLNTLINGMQHSRLVPPLPATPGNYEGCGYLGAGVLFLGLMTLGLSLVPRFRANLCALPWSRARWLSIATLGCTVYALASPIRWGEHEVLNIEAYRSVDSIVGAFRSSGRFIWILQYGVVLAVAMLVVRALRAQRAWTTAVLLIAIAIQAYDIDPGYALSRFAGPSRRPLLAAEWSLAQPHYQHLVLFPAEVVGQCAGPQGYREQLVTELGYLAYRQRWTINSGYAARTRRGTVEYCRQLQADLVAGVIDPRSVYIVGQPALAGFRRRGAVCGKIDDLFACVRSSQDPFAAYLAAHRD